jgi:hypothetical protein
MQKVALQTGTLLGLGATVLLAKKMFVAKVHPLVAEHKSLVAREPALAQTLTLLVDAPTEEASFVEILTLVDEILRLHSVKNKTNQWYIARLNGEVVRRLRHVCTTAGRQDDGAFQNALLAQDEYIPQVETLLDNMLHNYLLDT